MVNYVNLRDVQRIVVIMVNVQVKVNVYLMKDLKEMLVIKLSVNIIVVIMEYVV